VPAAADGGHGNFTSFASRPVVDRKTNCICKGETMSHLPPHCWTCRGQTAALIAACPECVDVCARLRAAATRLEQGRPDTRDADRDNQHLSLYDAFVSPEHLGTQASIDRFFFGWLLQPQAAPANEAPEASFTSFADLGLTVQSEIDKFLKRPVEWNDKDVILYVEMVRSNLYSRTDKHTANEIIPYAVGWFARSLQVVGKPLAALRALAHMSSYYDRVPALAAYQILQLMGEVSDAEIWSTIGDYWIRWGGNWEGSVKNKDLRLAVSILTTSAIEPYPVLASVTERDATTRRLSDLITWYVETRCRAIKDTISRDMWFIRENLSNMTATQERHEGTIPIFGFITGVTRERIKSARALLDKCTNSPILAWMKGLEDMDDYAKLRAAVHLAKEARQRFADQSRLHSDILSGKAD
jgi:hypothetical protein